MKDANPLAVQTTGADVPDVVRHQPGEFSLEAAFRAVVAGEVKPEHVAVMKELLAMDAVRKFNCAFVELQQSLPVIPGFRGIPDKQGNIKFRYANFEDIDAIVRPICLRSGFTYSFRETAYGDGRTTTTMTLMHAAGHSIEVPCTVRIGGGPPGTSEAQNDGGAHTYGKRNALEMGLGLRIVGQREDARVEGNATAKITPQQAEELERRVKDLADRIDMPKWWEFCKATTFKDIPANKYEECNQMLRRKEQGR